LQRKFNPEGIGQKKHGIGSKFQPGKNRELPGLAQTVIRNLPSTVREALREGREGPPVPTGEERGKRRLQKSRDSDEK